MTSHTPSRPGRIWSWLADSADGMTGWLIVCAIFAGFGFWFVPGDYQDRNAARHVARSGLWVTATDVEVHVDYEYAKGGGWYEVDHVRARLPGSAGITDLDAVANEETLSDRFDWHEGWQPATGATGYQAPLRVRVEQDGDGTPKEAVAERDVTYWTVDNYDPEIGLGIGGGSLLIGLLSLCFKSVFTRRTRSRRTSGSYPGVTRAERRAARDRDDTGVWSAGKAGRSPRRRRR